MKERRPDGCHFDAYGADEEFLRTLTCENCPLVSMVCDYKGEVALTRLARSMHDGE